MNQVKVGHRVAACGSARLSGHPCSERHIVHHVQVREKQWPLKDQGDSPFLGHHTTQIIPVNQHVTR